MATQILVPVLGEAIGEARVAAWLKRPGDAVRRGDELAELETDKAMLALECPADGVLLEILVSEGAFVTTGQLLARVGRPNEAAVPMGSVPAATADPVPAAAGQGVAPASPAPINVAEPAPLEIPAAPAEATAASPDEALNSERQRISPAARRMARESGIDLRLLTPGKPGSRITTQDVARLSAAQTGGSRVPQRRQMLSEIQRVMANRMLQSTREIPQFSVTVDVDAAQLLRVQQELAVTASHHRGNGSGTANQEGKGVSLTALLVYLTARMLRQHPLLNARYDGDAVILYETANMGVAVTTPQGLVVPVVHGADQLGIWELAQRWGELVQAARSGRLTLGQVSDGTFTLSNLGMYGVREFVPLVNPPQAAILGIGGLQPAVQPEASGTRHVQRMSLTVSADHRVVDGAAAAAFLQNLKQSMEQADIT